MPQTSLLFVRETGNAREKKDSDRSLARSHAATISQRKLKAERQRKSLKPSTFGFESLSGLPYLSAQTQRSLGSSAAESESPDTDVEWSIHPGFGHYRTELYAHMPHEHSRELFLTLDFYSLHVWPNNDLACEVFNVINFFPMFFGSMADKPTFSANVAAMRLLHESMLGHGPSVIALALQGQALNSIRKRLILPSPESDDNLLVAVAILASVQKAMGQREAYESHRDNLARMIRMRGGLSSLQEGSLARGALMMFDSTWTTQSGISIFPNQRRHCNIIPPPSIETTSLPPGFATLAASNLLAPDLLTVLLRAIDLGLTTHDSLPHHVLSPANHPTSGRFHDFREACPCMGRKTSLDALIVHALQIFCAIGFTDTRIPTNILAMPRFELALGLPVYVDEQKDQHKKNKSDDTRKMEKEADEEVENCLMWIWMLAIEAFSPYCGSEELQGQGKFLMRKFEMLFMSRKRSKEWVEVERVVRRFFWTRKLSVAWRARWLRATSGTTAAGG